MILQLANTEIKDMWNRIFCRWNGMHIFEQLLCYGNVLIGDGVFSLPVLRIALDKAGSISQFKACLFQFLIYFTRDDSDLDLHDNNWPEGLQNRTQENFGLRVNIPILK